METERIGLSQRERDRLKVLHEVQQKHVRQVEAARRLQLSERQVRRLLVRIAERGDPAIVHRLRGRPSQLAPLSHGCRLFAILVADSAGRSLNPVLFTIAVSAQ